MRERSVVRVCEMYNCDGQHVSHRLRIDHRAISGVLSGCRSTVHASGPRRTLDSLLAVRPECSDSEHHPHQLARRVGSGVKFYLGGGTIGVTAKLHGRHVLGGSVRRFLLSRKCAVDCTAMYDCVGGVRSCGRGGGDRTFVQLFCRPKYVTRFS